MSSACWQPLHPQIRRRSGRRKCFGDGGRGVQHSFQTLFPARSFSYCTTNALPLTFTDGRSSSQVDLTGDIGGSAAVACFHCGLRGEPRRGGNAIAAERSSRRRRDQFCTSSGVRLSLLQTRRSSPPSAALTRSRLMASALELTRTIKETAVCASNSERERGEGEGERERCTGTVLFYCCFYEG